MNRFKAKYHPEEFGKRKQEQHNSLQRRLDVFMKLYEGSALDNISLDLDCSEKLVKFLDAAVVLLEGGTEQDILALDQPPEEEKEDKPTSPVPETKEEPTRSASPAKSKDSDNENEADNDKTDKEEGAADSDSDSSNSDSESKPKQSKKKEKLPEPDQVKEELKEEPKFVPLHKTYSIFLRNLAPNITKQEVEAICKKYPGFLRVAIADPQPERRFFRRGWVTFKPTVNIKDICWNLNNIRLREFELGAIINRDLSRRIRNITGIASHKTIVKSDIKTAARIIQHLDSQKELWTEKSDDQSHNSSLSSKNPLLRNITDYLIEEASAEEEELLGVSESKENLENSEDILDHSDPLVKVLDKLLLYLRVVHSLDYYSSSDYPCEDEMPNRCGIIHARGSPPTNKPTQIEINSYLETFDPKINIFLQPQTRLSEEEALKFGKKDPNAEVDKFVQANTQELAKDKWVCPLSGKKFKGPEFVQKHILNKHGDKIDEVRVEVEYFNNYLLDPRRPQLPEHPSSKGGVRPDIMFPVPPFNMRPMPGPGFPGFGRPDGYPRPYGKRNYAGRLKSDPRELISYQDLDMPQEADIF